MVGAPPPLRPEWRAQRPPPPPRCASGCLFFRGRRHIAHMPPSPPNQKRALHWPSESGVRGPVRGRVSLADLRAAFGHRHVEVGGAPLSVWHAAERQTCLVRLHVEHPGSALIGSHGCHVLPLVAIGPLRSRILICGCWSWRWPPSKRPRSACACGWAGGWVGVGGYG